VLSQQGTSRQVGTPAAERAPGEALAVRDGRTRWLSSVEVLVSLLVEHNDQRVRKDRPPRTVFGPQDRLHHDRPRAQDCFARIEGWVNLTDVQDTC
jgi:hypothetical protein